MICQLNWNLELQWEQPELNLAPGSSKGSLSWDTSKRFFVENYTIWLKYFRNLHTSSGAQQTSVSSSWWRSPSPLWSPSCSESVRQCISAGPSRSGQCWKLKRRDQRWHEDTLKKKWYTIFCPRLGVTCGLETTHRALSIITILQTTCKRRYRSLTHFLNS